MTDWLTFGMNDRLADWLTDWLTDLLACLLTDWATNWFVEWLTSWLASSLTDWLTGWLLSDWVTGWQTDWLTDQLQCWVTGRLRGHDRWSFWDNHLQISWLLLTWTAGRLAFWLFKSSRVSSHWFLTYWLMMKWLAKWLTVQTYQSWLNDWWGPV